MKRTILLSLITLFLLVAVQSCKSTKKLSYSPTGAWNFQIRDTPYGNFDGEMVVTNNGDNHSVVLKTVDGDIQIEEVKIEENKLTGRFDYDGTPLDIEGVFEGESFAGQIKAGYDGFPMTATRKK